MLIKKLCARPGVKNKAYFLRFSLLVDELSFSSFKDKNDGLELFEVLEFELDVKLIALFVELVFVLVVDDEEAGVLFCCCC
jgi:hypothetical protein